MKWPPLGKSETEIVKQTQTAISIIAYLIHVQTHSCKGTIINGCPN